MGVNEGAATLPTDGTTIAAGLADSANLWWALSGAERVGATNDGKKLLAQAVYAWDGSLWRRILIDTSGRIIAVGGAAHDAAAAGNPLRVAGVYRATPAAVADGDVVDLFTDAAGRQNVVPYGAVTVTHTTATITTASGVALAANTSRKYALFINDSDTVIYLMVSAAAVANQGIRLNANGGSYEMSHALGNLDTRVVNAIHGGSGNKVLLVAEG